MVGSLFLYTFFSSGLIGSPAFFMSSYLERNRSEYYLRLQNISKDNDLQGWVVFFMKAIVSQARDDTSKAKSILALYEEMKNRVVDLTHSQFAIHALDTLFMHPIFSSPQFVSRSNIPKPSAARLLKALSEGDVLHVIRPGRGKRSTIYAFSNLLSLVNAEGPSEA